jgi:hypothetical protein
MLAALAQYKHGEEVYPGVARSVGFVSILLPAQFWAVDSKSSAQIQSPGSAHLPEDRRAVGIEPIQTETLTDLEH